jgi:predicted CXXCH cytochrome family protein
MLVSGVALLAGFGFVKWWSVTSSLKAERESARLAAALPKAGAVAEHVSSQSCQSCHPSQHASWHRTYHRTMTQVALPETVAGDFSGATVQSHDLTYRVFRKGEQFWAEMPDPDVMMYVIQGGKKLDVRNIPRVEQRVVMTTGSHHYQTYWVSSPRYERLLQTLPLVYLLKDKRWIPRKAAFMRPPEDMGSFITQWNHHCIRCHSTAGNPGLNPKTGLLDTTVAEFGIACESCHGPGQEHISRNRDPFRRYRLHLTGARDETIVNPAKLDHRLSSHICGQCHGVYVMRDEFAMKSASEGPLYRAGEDLDKTRYYIRYPTEDSSTDHQEDRRKNPEFFRERWWDDGTILAGGREYSAMAVSRCYTQGQMSCLSCHSMHDSDPAGQVKRGLTDNQFCIGCHREAEYTAEIGRHTFHDPKSAGSNCLNCHMPHTTYALFRAIRSHQIAAPNPASSIRFGVPNACNLCHLDKTLEWTQQTMAKWYGTRELPLSEEQKSVSAALLWLLKGHAAQRVVAAWHVGWPAAHHASGNDWLAPFQAQLLADPYGVVRYVAETQLRALPGFENYHYDFLAPESELRRHTREAVLQWRKLSPRSQKSGEAVLIATNGTLMEAKVHALLGERDPRPVTIKE